MAGSQISNIAFPLGPMVDQRGYLTEPYRQFFLTPAFVQLIVNGGFGCNGAQPQLAYPSGGSLPPGATNAQIITLLNNIQAALVANGIMS